MFQNQNTKLFELRTLNVSKCSYDFSKIKNSKINRNYVTRVKYDDVTDKKMTDVWNQVVTTEESKVVVDKKAMKIEVIKCDFEVQTETK